MQQSRNALWSALLSTLFLSAASAQSWTLSGTVRDATTGEAIAGATIEATSDFLFVQTITDEAGSYTLERDEAGVWFVTADTDGYLGELYENLPCEESCSEEEGTPFDLLAGDTLSDIDFDLTPAGSISGTVVDDTTGEPIQTTLYVYNSDGLFQAFESSDPFGHYTTEDLPVGDYFVETRVSDGHLDEVYSEITCLPDCDPVAGDPISVVAGSVTTGIDFTLTLGGVLSGTVNDQVTGAPVVSALWIYDEQGKYRGQFSTDEQGQFTADGLAPGTHYLRTANLQGYLDALYGDLPCPPAACDVGLGDPIEVSLDEEITGVDIQLRAGGRISGRVVEEATGLPSAELQVRIYNPSLRRIDTIFPDDNGDYLSNVGLDTANYHVWVQDRYVSAPHFVEELYGDLPCTNLACDARDATLVPVTLGETTSGIDFLISEGGSVSGVITDEMGQPLEGASVSARNENGVGVVGGNTDENGVFTTEAAAASGDYFVTAYLGYTSYVAQLFDGIECPYEACDVGAGTAVSVTAGADTPAIDLTLSPGGTLSGSMSSPDGLPIESEVVSIYDEEGRLAGQGLVIDGAYESIEGLPSGTYFVKTDHPEGYADQLYSGIPCPAACDATLGTPVVVSEGAETQEIDFSLVAGTAPAHDHCADAIPVVAGIHLGTNRFATHDGDASCGLATFSRDVWYRYTAPEAVTVSVDTCDPRTDFDTALSLHRGCDEPPPSDLRCNDDDLTCDAFPVFRLSSATSIDLGPGDDVYIRVAGRGTREGDFALRIDDGLATGMSLDLSGSCPGMTTVEVHGASPGGRLAIVGSAELGPWTLPVTDCAGTELDVVSPQLLGTPTADGSGSLTFTRSVAGGVCDRNLQVMDLDTCEVSNTAPMPTSAERPDGNRGHGSSGMP